MGVDVLILNSGEWVLGDELPAEPWHVLIYRQRSEPRNELHIWLPREDAGRTADYAFRRYWVEGGLRWCVELPPDPTGRWGQRALRAVRFRFTGPDGRVLWSDYQGGEGLADLSHADLTQLRHSAEEGPYAGY